MSPRALIVAADVHLSHGADGCLANALVKLVEAAAGCELVLAGDTFTLSEERPGADPLDSTAALLARYPAIRAALARHLAAGHPFTLLAGNHDAGLTSAGAALALAEVLGVEHGAPLAVEPWFIRRGPAHIEHGHVHDPDNAPLHPLAPWSVDTEPLGVSITRHFLVPSGALDFAHAHETTPTGGLVRAFRLYGARAPGVIARYFEYALRRCVIPRERFAGTRALGEAALGDFARSKGHDPELLRRLADLAPVPTHAHLGTTFRRLYLDRVSAALTLPAGGALALLATPIGGTTLALGGAGYLSTSLARGASRYRGMMEARLRGAARAISELSGARLVVFGHTHREEEAGGYVNTGSFGFDRGQGRPYLRIDPAGRWERRRVVGG